MLVKRTAIFLAMLAAASPAMAQIVVASATDSSRSTSIERARNAATLRRTLDRLIGSQTCNAHVDATIVSLTVEPAGDLVVVSAQVRLAISDPNGRILSVLTGGAKVETDARGFRPRQLPRMRDDAMFAAVEGMASKVKRVVGRCR